MSGLRAALRGLRRAPGVPATVAALTAVGMGLVLGLWAILDAAFFRPLPFPDASALVFVMESHPQRGDMAVAVANFLDWSPQTRSFAAVGGTQALDMNLGAGATVQRLAGAGVTPSYFDVWRVPPLRGRTFSAADYDGDAHVAVLSARVWRQTLGAAESVIGSTVRLDGRPYTVLGVMPPESSLVGRIDVWVPWQFEPRQRTERRFHELGAVARLAPGVTAAQATTELTAAYAQLAAEHPDTTRDWRAKARPLREVLVTASSQVPALLAGAVVATLGVAVLNIVALLAGWWPQRRVELVTRRALGADTAALVRQLALEGGIVMAVGAVAGVAVARAFVAAFAAVVVPSTPMFAIEPALDLRALGAALLLLSMLVVVTIVVPAWRMATDATDLVPRRAAPGAGRPQLAIALQVAAAFVLLVTSAALLDSAGRLSTLAAAPPRERIAVEISLPTTRYAEEAAQRSFFQRVLDEVRALPDVADLGATSYVPPTDALGNMRFEIEGRAEASELHTASPAAVDERALPLLGVRVLRGRGVEARDDATTANVVVISDALARRYWPDGNPIGARIRLVGVEAPYTIVGVAADVRRPTSSDPRAETVMYFSYRQVPWPFMTLLVEPRGDTSSALAGIRRAVTRLDPDQAMSAVRSLTDVQSEWLVQPRLQGRLVALFAGSTLLLTLAGLYARVAYAVARRVRECAIRQAVGATPAGVRWWLMSGVAAGAAAGLGLGALALPAFSSAVAPLVFETSMDAWPRVAGIAALLGVTAAAACYLPARALRGLDLARVLRTD